MDELYLEAYEELEAELGRTPTDKEVEERAIDTYTSRIDDAYDEYKETGGGVIWARN